MERNPVVCFAGASGLIGRALVAAVKARGGRAVRLVRGGNAAGDGERLWDPVAVAAGDAQALSALQGALTGVGAVVNLAGASIGEGRFTAAHKQRVIDSRVHTTRAIGRALAGMAAPPAVWLQASATGYYGDTGDDEKNENSAAGDNFLAQVCRAWEAAATETPCKARLVIARLGVVLDAQALAWQKLTQPIRLGAGGPLGSGRQYFAWITLDDAVRALLALLDDARAVGPVNLVAPEPVRQAELVRAIGKRLHRPAFVPTPAFALRLLLGRERADNLVLASSRVVPARLQALGFQFQQPSLDAALARVLGSA